MKLGVPSACACGLLGFLLISAGYSRASQKRETTPCTSQEGIAIEIGLREGQDGPYRVGNPIAIKTVIRNTGKSPRRVRLDDHDEYHGTRPFPDGTYARIRDSNGTVLTRNDSTNDDWWSFEILQSTLSQEMPGDAVTIPPGEEVVRIIPLDRVLLGCKRLPYGLRRGTYMVQLSLCGIVSNELKLQVQ